MLNTKPEEIRICIDIKQKRERNAKLLQMKMESLNYTTKQIKSLRETISHHTKILKKTYCF